MASSPLPFPFPPTTTSYRAGSTFKFEMCQSAPRHPVYIYIYIYIYIYVCVCVCVYYRTKSEIVSIHDIKVGRESGGTNPLILISALGRGEWSPSRPCSFIPRKEPLYPLNRQARWAAEGVWMVLEKRKFFPP